MSPADKLCIITSRRKLSISKLMVAESQEGCQGNRGGGGEGLLPDNTVSPDGRITGLLVSFSKQNPKEDSILIPLLPVCLL